jgi:hypothetical protein
LRFDCGSVIIGLLAAVRARADPLIFADAIAPPIGRIVMTFMIGRLFVCVYFLAASLTSAAAQSALSWKVEGKLRGEPKGASDFKKSKDVSGIACDNATGSPRLCLVVDDETQGAQIVLLTEGELRVGEYIPLTNAQFDDKPLELDAEGVAFDGSHFYVTGSFGRARHESDSKKEAKNNAKAAATRQIFRIALPVSAVDMKTGMLIDKPVITPSSTLAGLLQNQPEIAPFYDKALKDNGLTIEGIAVRDQRLYIGMRGPVIGTDAAVLSVATAAVFDGQEGPPTLHKVALGMDRSGKPRGIRDMVSYRSSILVLAGPVNDPPDDTPIGQDDYAIYLWDGDSKADRLYGLKPYGKKTKPEALLPLDGDAEQVRLLMMFDGPDEGEPTPLSILLR